MPPPGPSHTTGRAGPHPAVRRVEVTSLAAMALRCSTTCSISSSVSSVPERSVPFNAVDTSPLCLRPWASPRFFGRSSSCPVFWRMVSSSLMVVSLSSPFDPSRSKVFRPRSCCPGPASQPLLWPLLTSRSALVESKASGLGVCPPVRLHSSTLASPFQAQARSPQVRDTAFAARSPDIRHTPLVVRASRRFARSPWDAPPRIRSLYVDPQLLLSTSFSLSLAAHTLWFA